MQKNQEFTYYPEYLELHKLLDAQHPKSAKYEEVHDETLFIVVHQVYELWFKQILHEFDSIVSIFSQKTVEEKFLSLAVARLERVIKIQGLLLNQLPVLETMTPMDFLEFRDLLIPASGFQSVQFREVEIKMGLGTAKRHAVDRDYFFGRLTKEHQNHLLKVEQGENLLTLLGQWLERIPFLQIDQFDFWDEYKQSVDVMLKADESIIKSNTALPEKQKEMQLANFLSTKETFNSLLDKDQYDEQLKEGNRKISQKAMLSALFIMLYRDEPMLNTPFRFLNALMDIDENFTTWRHRHALMGHRMLGTKIGTGGSSGHKYLKMAADHNKVYTDLFDLSTFLIPRSKLPKLPKELKAELDFHFSTKTT